MKSVCLAMALVLLATFVIAVLGTAVFIGFGALLSKWLPLSLFQASGLVVGAAMAMALVIHGLISMTHFRIDHSPDDDEFDWDPDDEADTQAVLPGNNVPKAGRNTPCPCGSGKKLKHCCGKSTVQ